MKSVHNVNMREIARLSGVAPSTVSRVLNKRAGIIPIASETRERVMEAVNKLGYRPNVHAKRLFSQKSSIIGMVVPPSNRLTGGIDNKNALHVDVLQAETLSGAVDAARRRNYHIMVIVADDAFLREKDYLNLFRSRNIDGLLIWGICLDENYVEELAQEQNSFILLNTHQGGKNYNRICVNNYGGSATICRHLLQLNHQRIAYIGGMKTSTIGLEREEGFLDVLKAENRFNPRLFIRGDYSLESGEFACQTLLKRDPTLTAIGCANDRMALGAIEAIKKHGLRVPEDISITGADACFPFSHPRLTSFCPPLIQVGLKGAEALIDHLENREVQENNNPWIDLLLEPEFVPGESTGFCK